MTVGFGIKVLLEVAVVLLIAYGYMNEEKLIAFEREFYAIMKFCVKKYILKTYQPKKAQVKPQAKITHRAEIKVFPGVQNNHKSNVA
ncbi:MAG: hypothetical protein PUD72_07400 [Oscillospiraceae bacterium]|nr:hypothetical protein [Oscillospiraceae bacterium]